MAKNARIKKEMSMLIQSPPPGAQIWQVDDKVDSLEANIVGPPDTPYSGGIFKLEILIPDRYPFEPPKMRFVTKIYHPNVDDGGRICLDILKLPPHGSWKPSINISSCLTSLQVLMSEPNPDDPLMPDIADQLRYHKDKFSSTATEWTQKYAFQKKVNSHKRLKVSN